MPITLWIWQIYFHINGKNLRVRKNPTKVNENLEIIGVTLINPGVFLIFVTRARPKAYVPSSSEFGVLSLPTSGRYLQKHLITTEPNDDD